MGVVGCSAGVFCSEFVSDVGFGVLGLSLSSELSFSIVLFFSFYFRYFKFTLIGGMK